MRSGLSRLESVIDQIRSESGGQTITISAGSGIASYWLTPQLAEMQLTFPDHQIRIITQSHDDDAVAGDLQIRFGDGQWPGIDMAKILGEQVFPVCSPLYLSAQDLPLSLEDLKSEQLLGMEVDRRGWFEWRTWFDAIGEAAPKRQRILNFDSYVLLVNAALAGHGICLCWSGLLDVFIDTGALVKVSELFASSTRGYYVTHRSDLAPDSPARAIARWLGDERNFPHDKPQ